MADELAVDGGEPVREASFPDWPVWDDRERDALIDALESGTWGVNGSRTGEFCEEYARRHDAEHAVAVTSGTTAIHVALKAAGVEPGDEVIVPPYTFVATASAVVECNAVPIFADIEHDSLCLDPADVESKLTDRTAAVVPVHLGGRPADVEGLKEICDPRDVAIVEDCAHAHGGRVGGEALGTLGDAGCFSFQSSKNLPSGEGGLILTDDDQLYRDAWSIHNVGRVPEGDWYEHPVLGSNYRMTEFQAGLLQAGLTRLDEHLERRARSARLLDEGLGAIDGIQVQSDHPDTTTRAYHLYVFRLDRSVLPDLEKGDFMEAVRAEGVPVGGGYSALYDQELFTRIEETAPAVCELAEEVPDYGSVECPETERAEEDVCWTSQSLLLGDDEDMQDVVRAVEKVVDRADSLGE